MAITAWSAKGVSSFNLLLGERAHGTARQRQRAERSAFAQQRHTDHGAPASQLLLFRLPVLGISQNVGDVNHAAFKRNTPDKRLSSGREAIMLHVLLIFGGITA